jgi:hypothetical protein
LSRQTYVGYACGRGFATGSCQVPCCFLALYNCPRIFLSHKSVLTACCEKPGLESFVKVSFGRHSFLHSHRVVLLSYNSFALSNQRDTYRSIIKTFHSEKTPEHFSAGELSPRSMMVLLPCPLTELQTFLLERYLL